MWNLIEENPVATGVITIILIIVGVIAWASYICRKDEKDAEAEEEDYESILHSTTDVIATNEDYEASMSSAFDQTARNGSKTMRGLTPPREPATKS